MCTLIGTSTNLIVNDLMVVHELERMHMFELAWIGSSMRAFAASGTRATRRSPSNVSPGTPTITFDFPAGSTSFGAHYTSQPRAASDEAPPG